MDKQDKSEIKDDLNNEYTIKFKKREWIVIYNLIGWDGGRPRLFTLGDAQLINPILDQIKRFADIQTQEPEKKEPNGVITN